MATNQLRKKSKLLLCATFVLLLSGLAQANELSLAGGINIATVTQTTATKNAFNDVGGDQSSGIGFIGGVLGAFDIAPSFALESGLLYARKSVDYNFNTLGLVGGETVAFKWLEIPVVARYQVLENLGMGLGGYYARGIGSITSNTTGFLAAPSTSTQFNDASVKRNDYGLVFNLRGSLPLDETWGLGLDARYLLGLANLNTDGNANDNFKVRDMEFLAEVVYHF